MRRTLAATLISMTISATAFAQATDQLPDGAGKPLVQRMCVGCHKLQVVTSKRATHEQWETIVQQMVARGADGTDEEIATVIDYLAKNYPAPVKPADRPQTSLNTRLHPANSHAIATLISDRSWITRSWITASQCDVNALFRLLRSKPTLSTLCSEDAQPH